MLENSGDIIQPGNTSTPVKPVRVNNKEVDFDVRNVEENRDKVTTYENEEVINDKVEYINNAENEEVINKENEEESLNEKSSTSPPLPPTLE